ncbi:hypothetical protein GCM10025868_43620 [Angustibacter aerolatus]|uniref:Uncharacterized protein n=1 Tax=Angustibacter aerolatus TaxID=1162965 RepID=A0ABQ6JLG3_9ACTN|nr:hypothetical protein GCM10025868_43620 [Angustibacter aerolatus]
MLVAAQVDLGVVAAVPGARAGDEQRRALPAPLVAAGGVARHQRGQQPVGERLPGGREPPALERVDDVLADQDVALHRVVGAGPAARPVAAARPGEGRPAVRPDDAE